MPVTEKDFENAPVFHDHCPTCKETSDDFQAIKKDNKYAYRCPNCGDITTSENEVS